MPIRLVIRNLLAHPLRSLLTCGSVFVAVFLLCALRATTTALTSSVEQAATSRLWVQSAVSLFVDLPLAYESKIATVEGVDWICRWQWFGGEFRDASGFFAQFGVDADTFLKSYPEIDVIDGSDEAFIANRTGCLIGEDLAVTYGWKVGDAIPIISKIFDRGGKAWDFRVEGIYHSNSATVDQNTLYFHYDYLRESLEAGEAFGPPGVGVYMVKVADNTPPEQVMAEIDALFENGPQRVQATTEREFQRSFIAMLGNVPALLTMIGGAVLFAIFFAVLNTMLMAARERVRSTGIMKALGFSNGTILGSMVLEGVLLCGVGGLAAVALAYGSQETFARMMVLAGITGYEIDNAVAGLGLALALGLGLVAGLIPGIEASRLTPVRALRMEA